MYINLIRCTKLNEQNFAFLKLFWTAGLHSLFTQNMHLRFTLNLCFIKNFAKFFARYF